MLWKPTGEGVGESGARGGGTSLDLHFRKMMLAVLEKWASQTVMLHRVTWELTKMQIVTHCVWRGACNSASTQLPGEADAGGPWITLWGACLYKMD